MSIIPPAGEMLYVQGAIIIGWVIRVRTWSTYFEENPSAVQTMLVIVGSNSRYSQFHMYWIFELIKKCLNFHV